jgi:Arc/MetJ family transcription regulator
MYDLMRDGCTVEAWQMRTTVTVDDELIEKAKSLTGIKENGELIRFALQKLVELEASRRLARLGGSDPNAWAPPRERPPYEADEFESSE